MPYIPVELPTDEVSAMETALKLWHPNLPNTHAKEVLREFKRVFGGGAESTADELMECGQAMEMAAKEWEKLRAVERFSGEFAGTMARAVIDKLREIRRRK